MVEHGFGSQREWMIQRELEGAEGDAAEGQERPRKCSRAEPPSTLFFAPRKCFSTLQTALPSRY